MKTRRGFVSNSSTTSYTCEVCGDSWAGSDSLSYREVGFWKCCNGHVICEEHVLDVPDLTAREMYDILLSDSWYSKEIVEEMAGVVEDSSKWEEIVNDFWDDFVHDEGHPERACPVCQFYEISNEDTARYLEKETGVPRDEAFAFIKEQNKRRKKLYNNEYVMYVCMKLQYDISTLPTVLKERFGTYRKFMEWLRES